MDGKDFLRVVKEAFSPFLQALGFEEDVPSISGRFYRASFSSTHNVISISFEPGDSALFIMVFSRENGELSDIDDRSRTPRLVDLNTRYLHLITNDELLNADAKFASIRVNDKDELFLLKAAKELSLVIPKHLQSDASKPDKTSSAVAKPVKDSR